MSELHAIGLKIQYLVDEIGKKNYAWIGLKWKEDQPEFEKSAHRACFLLAAIARTKIQGETPKNGVPLSPENQYSKSRLGDLKKARSNSSSHSEINKTNSQKEATWRKENSVRIGLTPLKEKLQRDENNFFKNSCFNILSFFNSKLELANKRSVWDQTIIDFGFINGENEGIYKCFSIETKIYIHDLFCKNIDEIATILMREKEENKPVYFKVDKYCILVNKQIPNKQMTKAYLEKRLGENTLLFSSFSPDLFRAGK